MKMLGHPLGTLFKPLIHSGLRLGLTSIIVLMVISSPVVMLVNPTLKAAPSTTDDYTSLAPSTIGQDGSDFTTQAALSGVSARPTNNIVTTTAFYDIVFVTATAGVIKTIEVTFPAGTQMAATPLLNEVEGIGPGTPSRSGQTIIYTVANAVNVPAGTRIRLEIANINNPVNPSTSYTVSVTTKNAANTPIDGPTPSTAFTMKQLGASIIAPGSITPTHLATGAVTTPKIADFAVTSSKLGTFSVTGPKLDTGSVSTSKLETFSVTAPKILDGSVTNSKIADGSITSTKPAESLMKRVTVLDNAAGNAVGWNPNGMAEGFTIIEPDVSNNPNVPFFTFEVTAPNGQVPVFFADCFPNGHNSGAFRLSCHDSPPEGSELHYVIGNLPEHTVQ